MEGKLYIDYIEQSTLLSWVSYRFKIKFSIFIFYTFILEIFLYNLSHLWFFVLLYKKNIKEKPHIVNYMQLLSQLTYQVKLTNFYLKRSLFLL